MPADDGRLAIAKGILSDYMSDKERYSNWQVGDMILGTYEVTPIAGPGRLHYAEGGMGRVYRVFHHGWNTELALKVPLQEFFKDPKRFRAFEEECQTWVNLALHPNTVACHYVRRIEGVPAIFAEFVDGGTLASWIDSRELYRDGPRESLARTLDIAIQAAWGLHHAHQQGVVHQDVKPSNIMLTMDGAAKITDFGIAQALSRTATTSVPIHGIRVQEEAAFGGMTYAYCSPEQAQAAALRRTGGLSQQLKLKRQTDIWSWALCVLEMFLGGQRWTAGIAGPAVLSEYANSGVWEQDVPQMPEAVIGILRHCFKMNPDDRPRDMAEVATELRDLFYRLLGVRYERPVPQLIEFRASTLNNKALSLLDLGDRAKAHRMLDQAIRADPLSPEATYNLGLLDWRSAQLTDDMLLTQLTECARQRPEDPQAGLTVGLVHLERGDILAAITVLESVRVRNGADREALEALKQARIQPHLSGQCLKVLGDHAGNLTDLAVTPDGKSLVSSAWDKTVRIWNLPSLDCRQILTGHAQAVAAIAISPDGRTLVTGGRDGRVGVWELPAGRNIRWIDLAGSDVWSVAISPDGRLCAVASDNIVKIYELGTGFCVQSLEGHTGLVSEARFQTASRIVTVSWDGTMTTWDSNTGSPLSCVELYASGLLNVEISPSGGSALVGCEDGTLHLVNLVTGTHVAFRGHGGRVGHVAWTPDGLRGLSASSDQTLRMWEISTGRCLRTFAEHTSSVNAVATSIDGRTGFSGGSDNILRVWDLSYGNPSPFVVSRPRPVQVLSTAQAENTNLLIRARRAIEKGDIETSLQLIRQVRGDRDFDVSQKTLDVLAAAGRLSVRRQLSTSIPMVLKVADGQKATCVAIEPNDREAAAEAASLMTFGKLWQCRHADEFGRLALVGFASGDVHLFDLHARRTIRAFESQVSHVERIAFLPGGMHCEITPRLKESRIYELSTGRKIQILPDIRSSRRLAQESAACSWDGTRKLLSGNDGLPLLIDGTRNLKVTLDTPQPETTCTAILPDGRFGFSGGRGRIIRMWDLSTRQCIYSFDGHRSHVTGIACSPDARWILSVGEDGEVRSWELVWDYEFPGWADKAENLELIITTLLDSYGAKEEVEKSQEHLCHLLLDLRCIGFGWVRAEAIREALLKYLNVSF
jgi:WD40 repeat protein/serine/threonine protein kinase